MSEIDGVPIPSGNNAKRRATHVLAPLAALGLRKQAVALSTD
jgi:hypothetical protein